MFEQVKTILTEQYNAEMKKFDELKSQIDAMEEVFKNDTSEADYQSTVKGLNAKYGLFKRGKEYKKELRDAQIEYDKKLKQYDKDYKKYLELKNEAAKINIYIIQKKLEQLMNANSLEDIKMTEAEAEKIINEGV